MGRRGRDPTPPVWGKNLVDYIENDWSGPQFIKSYESATAVGPPTDL